MRLPVHATMAANSHPLTTYACLFVLRTGHVLRSAGLLCCLCLLLVAACAPGLVPAGVVEAREAHHGRECETFFFFSRCRPAAAGRTVENSAFQYQPAVLLLVPTVWARAEAFATRTAVLYISRYFVRIPVLLGVVSARDESRRRGRGCTD